MRPIGLCKYSPDKSFAIDLSRCSFAYRNTSLNQGIDPIVWCLLAGNIAQTEDTCGPKHDLLVPLRQGRRLFIGGLRKSIDNHTPDPEIRKVFSGFGAKPVSKVKWPNREPMQGNGCCALVDLDNAEEAKRVIQPLALY
jgi:hypothetical protein